MRTLGYRCLWFFLALAILVPLYAYFQSNLWSQRAEAREYLEAGYVVPSQFSRILACGYKGLLSDYQFLRILTFYGSRFAEQQQMVDEDWDYFVASIDVITDLDPYFIDPYVLTEGLLTWDAGRIEDANRLLLKGAVANENNWRLWYYLGFNSFYFMKDYVGGAEYLMIASRVPGSPDYLKTLSSRLAFYGGKTKTALLFLKGMLADTDDALLEKRLKTRLLALEGAVLIEEALVQFRDQQGHLPGSLNELVSSGYLHELPVEPYGGDWLFNKDARVFSTSKFTHR
ncbi:MAG: hypothetical protein C0619_10430 [Desulfuromonas sp.]|nr:MAG: hypothetical protein C0619_10430 [Desulfuromonas sp.]